MGRRLIERWMAKLASRKWWAWVMVMALATVLVWMGRIGPETWAWTVIWTTGVYMGANAAQKFSRAREHDKDTH